MLTCTSCSVQNPADNRFCGSCGATLAASCSACGTPLPAGNRFCGHCGTPVGTAVGALATVVAAAPITERRMCSVLFADLVGFTTLSESRDHEDVREVLSQYFELARTVIARYGGVVEKFIGDAVMAVWGTPVASEEDPERAVRAGLELVTAVTALGEELGAAGLALRAGVVTGEVAATLDAVGEGMVAGDAVNTAARVEAAAAPGSVWVDDVTHRLVEAAIGFTDAGEHELRGKAEPVRLWQATRVLSSVGGRQRVDGLEAPMLGRATEERTLHELFHACAERRAPRLLTVTGLAGTGKSRLGWEFEKYVDGLAESVWWHRGRCLGYGDGVSFWALAEAIRQRFEIAEEDPTDVATVKFRDRLVELVPDEQQRRFLGVRLGRLLGLVHPDDTGAPLTREELFEGWRQFLEHLALSGPVLLLVEDAQYADEALLDFLVHVVEWTREAAIFVVVFGRSELLEARPDLAVGRNRSAMILDVLDDRSMRELVTALVHDAPGDAVAKIVEQAQGNPLFAVETIRSLIDRDVVVPVGGEYRMVGDLGTLSVPNSLHGLLAARLDALDPQLRSLVADAAVVGTSFPAEALTAVSGRTAAEVVPGLAELVRRQILDVTVDPLSPQRGAYLFSQNLLRQVAYDTLSRKDRRTRHLAVARYLQDVFADGGEEIMEVIARHYLDALNATAGDDDAEIRMQAFRSLVRAGDRARRSGAQLRAAQAFMQAADLIAETDALECARVLEKAQEAFGVSTRYEEAFAAGGRARQLYLDSGDARGAARAIARNRRWISRTEHFEETLPLIEEAVEELRRDPDADTIMAFGALISAYVDARRFDDARALADEALGLAQSIDLDDRGMADVFGVAGVSNIFANRVPEAAVQLQHSRELAERVGDLTQQVRASNNLATIVVFIDAQEGVDLARSAATLARRCGDRDFLQTAILTLADALLLSGGWDDVLAEFAEQAQDVADLAADDEYELATAVLLALRGDPVGAAEHAVLPRLRTSPNVQDASYIAWVDSELAAAREDPAAVVEIARVQLSSLVSDLFSIPSVCTLSLAMRAAFALDDLALARELVAALDARPLGHLPAILRANLSLNQARLLTVEDQPGDVVDDAFGRAIGQLRAAGAPHFLAHGLLDLAEHEARLGRDSRSLREEARVIADRLGAADLRRRLDRTDVLAP